MKEILKRILIILSSGLIFFGVAYGYLSYSFKKSTAADQKEYSVPYRQIPQNTAVLVILPSGKCLSVVLDFQNMEIKVSDQAFDGDDYYSLTLSEAALAGIIDRIGGVNITIDGETYRYTGAQITECIKGGCDGELFTQIVTQIFTQISKNGFSKSDFVYLLEGVKTNLTVVDCISWIGYIKEMNIVLKLSSES